MFVSHSREWDSISLGSYGENAVPAGLFVGKKDYSCQPGAGLGFRTVLAQSFHGAPGHHPALSHTSVPTREDIPSEA